MSYAEHCTRRAQMRHVKQNNRILYLHCCVRKHYFVQSVRLRTAISFVVSIPKNFIHGIKTHGFVFESFNSVSSMVCFSSTRRSQDKTPIFTRLINYAIANISTNIKNYIKSNILSVPWLLKFPENSLFKREIRSAQQDTMVFGKPNRDFIDFHVGSRCSFAEGCDETLQAINSRTFIFQKVSKICITFLFVFRNVNVFIFLISQEVGALSKGRTIHLVTFKSRSYCGSEFCNILELCSTLKHQ